MHLVVDAVVVTRGSSAVVIEHLLRGWREEFPADRLTLLCGADGPSFPVPDGVAVETLRAPAALGPAGGLWLRTVGVRRATKRLGADAALTGVPASGLLGTGCPRGLI